jgi:pimeloyl-ACP methyl ester carboxylesterase
VCVVAASVVGVATAGPAAASSGRSGSDTHRIAWGPCDPPDADLQCGTLAVPLDWDRPRGKTLDLAVVRRAASDPGRRIGSMLVNPGGPGQSGVDLVRGGGEDFDRWGGGRFDIVGWDPRGTNRSSPVDCFTSDAARDRFWGGRTIPTTAEESRAYQRKAVELARRCGQVSGDLLDHISTADTVRDLDALRAAVGDRKITYVGLSYGTVIGQTYLALFPGNVRAMLLDGLVDAAKYTTDAETRTANDVAFADTVFDRFVALCQEAGKARCALAGNGESVRSRVDRLFARIKKSPIPAPHADPPGALQYADLLTATFNPLRLPSEWPQFAKDLEAAAGGDGSALLTNARPMTTPAGFAGATVSSAISCVDGPASTPSRAWPAALDRFTDSGKLWGPVLGWWLWAPCASNWPGRTDDAYRGPWAFTAEVPILLINNTFDPATSYPNAQATEKRIGNSTLLTNNGYGHPTYQDPSVCIDRARTQYLVDLVTPPKGTVCRPDTTPFPTPS